DLTPVREKRGPTKLLNMVPGRSKQVFSRWLSERTQAWRDGIEVVAMDEFTGFKTTSKEHLPDAVEVMDPFHVVQLAGDMLDRTRQRVQQETLGHRGRAKDPLYGVRRVLRTGEAFLTEKQQARLDAVFTDPRHADVWRAWRVYQQVVAAYREKLAGLGRNRLRELIDMVKATTPAWFTELRKLAYTLDRRTADILAYSDHPRTSIGPTEAINGRLEHLRGSALGSRNLTNHIARSLLEAGGFRPYQHSQMR
ncbi:MAG: ISL3 family transposase, partial [Actinobacteria bacterium]|nr:ISL3 family transposase [Actinomycetota bacterium]